MKPSAALERDREAIRRMVAAHRASNARILGSALNGLDGEGSDLDIIVAPYFSVDIAMVWRTITSDLPRPKVAIGKLAP